MLASLPMMFRPRVEDDGVVVSCPRGDQRCDALITMHSTRLHIVEQPSHERSFSLGVETHRGVGRVRSSSASRSQRIGTALMMAGIEGGGGGRVARAPRPSLYDEAVAAPASKDTTTPSLRPATCVVVTRASRLRFAEHACTNEQVNYSACNTVSTLHDSRQSRAKSRELVVHSF